MGEPGVHEWSCQNIPHFRHDVGAQQQERLPVLDPLKTLVTGTAWRKKRLEENVAVEDDPRAALRHGTFCSLAAFRSRLDS